LTIAHYYTPAGRCIQKPYEKGKMTDYAMDVNNRLKHGELMSADSIHFADSLKCYTLREHRTVYGGGGIMPDYFVPLDTTIYTPLHRQLAAKSVIINSSLRYIDNNRKKLKKQYPTFDTFKQKFEVSQEFIDEVLAEGEKQNVKPKDDEELQRTLPQLKLQLKALIARDLWDMSQYFSVMNEQNKIVEKALEVIQNS
ncbi:MAG: peptidase S41, partial [Prevotella sp.]|nr:peptidase S41 [Prevotella sp.]